MENVALPAKNILQATASTAVRIGLSNRQHLAIVASTINAGNHSALTDFSLSLASTFRQRQDTIQQVAEVVKKTWTKPQFAICHWDSKLMNRAGGIHEDRIAILISPSPKLLAIPSIARYTSAALAEAVMNALKE